MGKNLLNQQTSHCWIWGLALIVILGLVARGWLWEVYGASPQMAPDSFEYVELAKELARSGLFIDRHGSPEITRTPGYPLFLAVFYRLEIDLIYVVVVQNLITLVIAAILGIWIGRTYKPKIGLLSSLLITFNFPMMVNSYFILTEAICISLVTASFFLLLGVTELGRYKYQRALLGGLTIGLAVLVRPAVAPLVIPVTLYILIYSNRRWGVLLTFLCSFALAPVSWMIRNYVEVDQFVLSDISAVNLLLYQGAGTLALVSGDDYASEFITQQKRLRELASEQASLRASRRPSSEKTSDTEFYLDLFRKIAISHPGELIAHTARNIGLTLFGFSTSQLSRVFAIDYQRARYVALSLSSLTVVFLLLGLAQLWRQDRKFCTLAVFFITHFIVIGALTGVGGTRFRIPIEPIFCIAVAHGFYCVIGREKLRRRWSDACGKDP